MSMMIANAWVKEPIGGWEQVEVDTTKPYDGLEEIMEDLSEGFSSSGRSSGFKILRSWPRARCGNVLIYAVEMKSEYQLGHPDVNQAEWKAEITVVEE